MFQDFSPTSYPTIHNPSQLGTKWTFLHLFLQFQFYPILPQPTTKQPSSCMVQGHSGVCNHTHLAELELKTLLCWNLTLNSLSLLLPFVCVCSCIRAYVCVYEGNGDKTRQGAFFTCLFFNLFCTMAAMQRIPQAFIISHTTKILQRFVFVYFTFSCSFDQVVFVFG